MMAAGACERPASQYYCRVRNIQKSIAAADGAFKHGRMNEKNGDML